ncbi:hypothetical protein QF033_001670 [Bacillus pumilus]|nr:hypothetical protein [Bacillus pumilus]
MSMKIGEKGFKERIGEGLEDTVMRGAVSSAQERLYEGGYLRAKSLATGKSGENLARKSGSIR